MRTNAYAENFLLGHYSKPIHLMFKKSKNAALHSQYIYFQPDKNNMEKKKKYLTMFFLIFFFPGLQDVLPEFLRGRFVEAALSYVACNSEGELLCRKNDCWCRCSPRFPECNCPFADIKVMEENLEKSKQAWSGFNQEFMESGTHWNTYYKILWAGIEVETDFNEVGELRSVKLL